MQRKCIRVAMTDHYRERSTWVWGPSPCGPGSPPDDAAAPLVLLHATLSGGPRLGSRTRRERRRETDRLAGASPVRVALGRPAMGRHVLGAGRARSCSLYLGRRLAAARSPPRGPTAAREQTRTDRLDREQS